MKTYYYAIVGKLACLLVVLPLTVANCLDPTEGSVRGSVELPAPDDDRSLEEVPDDPIDDQVFGDCGANGLTWRLQRHVEGFEVDLVGCWGNGDCDAYSGDTACSEERPLLCISPRNAPNPGVEAGFNPGWTGADLALTQPIVGCAMTSLQAANELCRSRLGEGWRMAEFHDGGGGWSFYGFGGIETQQRFWVHIDDQPANCWDR